MRRPPELQAIFDSLQQEGPFTSVADAQRQLNARLRDYNARPQADLCGLSPDVVAQLLGGDWAGTGALRLTDTLSLGDLVESAILADARTLLTYVSERGPIRETATKSLPRAVVRELLPLLRMPTRYGESIDPEERLLNEGDVHWLFNLRHVLLFAGLLYRRKGVCVTPLGNRLLEDSRAGELNARLFRTLFRKFDLRALDRASDHPGLQQTVALSFYKLRTEARDWAFAEALAESAWLPHAKDPMNAWEAENVDLRFYSFRHRVLDPLVQFGLLQKRTVPGAERWKDRAQYRCTSLFDRFLRFELRTASRRDPFLMY